MDSIRTFIAITIPEDVRRKLVEAQDALRRTGADFKWVEPENLHLTVKFLGGVPSDRLPAVVRALQQAATGIPPFSVSLEGIGAFPDMSRPRVIWAGAVEGEKDAVALWRQVEDSMASVGFPPDERPFTLHLTLGRQRSPHRLAAAVEAARAWQHSHFGRFTVSSLTVFRSDLRPAGPVYTPIATVVLS